jgi:hypothetical protein
MHMSEKYYWFMCHFSNLEIAVCSKQGMIWEDTDDLNAGIYILLSCMNKLMLLSQNNLSVKNIEMLYHIILSHCIPVRDSLFSSVSVWNEILGSPYWWSTGMYSLCKWMWTKGFLWVFEVLWGVSTAV